MDEFGFKKLGLERTWRDVVVDCERILGCPDTAESPLMSNLPNLVRDLKHGIAAELMKDLQEAAATGGTPSAQVACHAQAHFKEGKADEGVPSCATSFAWPLERLIKHASSTHAQIHGRWVPARPLSVWGLYGLRLRLRAAWAVLRGKADAFTWPEGQ